MDITDFLHGTFLFNCIKSSTLSDIFADVNLELKKFKAKEVIYSPVEYEKKIGFVVEGKCLVERIKENGSAVALNTLDVHDSFGIMAVLSAEEYPTTVVAERNCSVLFMSADDFLRIIKKYPTVSMNVIRFLADRVSFLNKKVATFSSESVLKKLSSFLLNEYKRNASYLINISATKISEAISVGRASLYRAVSTLEAEGIISMENKKIYIKDPMGLERKTK